MRWGDLGAAQEKRRNDGRLGEETEREGEERRSVWDRTCYESDFNHLTFY